MVIAVEVSEIFGQKMNFLDHPETVEEYEGFKELLKNQKAENRSFLRNCVKGADQVAVGCLDPKMFSIATSSTAQLMAILA